MHLLTIAPVHAQICTSPSRFAVFDVEVLLKWKEQMQQTQTSSTAHTTDQVSSSTF